LGTCCAWESSDASATNNPQASDAARRRVAMSLRCAMTGVGDGYIKATSILPFKIIVTVVNDALNIQHGLAMLEVFFARARLTIGRSCPYQLSLELFQCLAFGFRIEDCNHNQLQQSGCGEKNERSA
jgi:hypothetical protein